MSLGVGLPEKVLTRLLLNVGGKVDGILDTTRDSIARQVRDGIEAGDSPRELGDRIEAATAFGEARAETIARTETAVLLNEAAIESYREYGITHVLVDDGDDDEACAAANGQTWTLDEAEADPIAHPNCVRSFSPIVTGEEDVAPVAETTPDDLLVDYREWQSDLTPEEAEALRSYQAAGYHDINATLRGFGDVDVSDEVRAIDSALARAVLPSDVTVYRAAVSEAFPAGDLTGAVITDAGYVSTTVDPVIGQKFASFVVDAGNTPVLVEMRLPAGTHAGYLDGLLADLGERELLLARNASFRVISDTLGAVHYAPYDIHVDGVRRLILELVR